MPSAQNSNDVDWEVAAVELADQIRFLRERAGLTQEELSYAAGLAKNTVGNIERAKNNDKVSNPRMESLFKIAKALNLPVVEVLTETFRHGRGREQDPARPGPKALKP